VSARAPCCAAWWRKSRVGEGRGASLRGRRGQAKWTAWRYHFWDEARFKAAVERGEFLEHAVVHGQHYGTLAHFVEERLAAGWDVVKDIDVQGVEQIRSSARFRGLHTVAVFVMPPSWRNWSRRLRGRGSEDEQSVRGAAMYGPG